jgi:hypothetical protein
MQPSQTRDSIAGAVDLLLRAGADDGSLRSDVQADDVVSGLIGIFLASGSPEQTGRLLDLLVAGVATLRESIDAPRGRSRHETQ